MSVSVLICDDSNLARKQMAKVLPPKWQQHVFFAGHGAQALELLKHQQIDVLFLDLNMPVLDGYQVLSAIQQKNIPVSTIVVSGDIQPEAYARAMACGAVDFIQKPIDEHKLQQVLNKLSHSSQEGAEAFARRKGDSLADEWLTPQLRDVYQEITNIAMGQAGDFLARLLNVFVKLPIPNVSLFEVSELHMALASVEGRSSTSAVCQGFIGSGIAGEALLILNDASVREIAGLLQFKGELKPQVELELLMDIANILIGALLKSLANQLDISFSQGHPVVLGQHVPVLDLINTNAKRWKKTLAIEISYGIEHYDISCDLLLLFSEESLKALNYKVEFLLEE